MSASGTAQQSGRGLIVKNGDLLVRSASAAILLVVALGAAYLGGLAAGIVAALFSFWSNTNGQMLRVAVLEEPFLLPLRLPPPL